MADNNLSPPHFNGTAVKDAEAWTRQFVNYCDYEERTDNKKLALMSVVNRGCSDQAGISERHRNRHVETSA